MLPLNQHIGKMLAHGHHFALKNGPRSVKVDFSGGEMAEWFKAHAWKACVGKTTVGSNPTLSASFLLRN